MHALVVDDSRAMRRIVGNMLREAGFEVTEAGNGREGLERLQSSQRPDLVLVDWNMPVMNGLAFLQALRAQRAYHALPVIMVTTETDIGRIQSALDAGANEYVMKPFTREILLGKLDLLGLTPR